MSAVACSFQFDARSVATTAPLRSTGTAPRSPPAEPALPSSSTATPSADPGCAGDALAGRPVEQVRRRLAEDVLELRGAGLYRRTLPGRGARRVDAGVLGHALGAHRVPGVGDQHRRTPAALAERG